MISRGFVFRGGRVIRAWAFTDPWKADTQPLVLDIEPGDVVFEADDTLSMDEFVGLAENLGRITPARVRQLMGAKRSYTIPTLPPVDPAEDSYVLRRIGRKGRVDVLRRKRVPLPPILGGEPDERVEVIEEDAPAPTPPDQTPAAPA